MKFDRKSVDTDLGLKSYMNTLISTHEVIEQFKLQRVLKYWGLKDEKNIYFMLAPPWIKFNPALVYSGIIRQASGLEKNADLEGKKGKEPILYSKEVEI